MKFEPELLKFADGRAVTGAEWPKRRNELIKILSEQLYGFSPEAPKEVCGRILSEQPNCCAGHATLQEIEISWQGEKGACSFPMHLFVPRADAPVPLVLLINFRKDAYDMYFPAEEIIDNGFALGVIYYNDITTDNADFTTGIAAMYERNSVVSWGKIGMWAFGMSRALDYLCTRPEFDINRIAAIGHSRLGKTALWCAAQDERVTYAGSNDSGCCGAALEKTRHEGGETLDRITTVFPFWFREDVRKNAGHEAEMPYDQHFLLAACAPRCVMVGSASLDFWADQYSEQLACVAASPAWELLGKTGYAGPEAPAKVGDDFSRGCIGYHLRDGVHFLSRADWLSYMDFMKNH